MLEPPPPRKGWCPHLGEILDPPLHASMFNLKPMHLDLFDAWPNVLYGTVWCMVTFLHHNWQCATWLNVMHDDFVMWHIEPQGTLVRHHIDHTTAMFKWKKVTTHHIEPFRTFQIVTTLSHMHTPIRLKCKKVTTWNIEPHNILDHIIWYMVTFFHLNPFDVWPMWCIVNFLHFSLFDAWPSVDVWPNVMYGPMWGVAQFVAWWSFTEVRVNFWKGNKFFSTSKQINNSTPG